MLDSSKVDNYIMSPVLAKYTGLYHIINPHSPRLGGLNISHLVVAVMVAFTMTCLACTPFGFYHWASDTTQLVLQLTALINFALGCFKAVTIVRHSDDIRTLLDVTRINFVSTDPQSFCALRKCRGVSSTFVVWFAAINYCVLLAWTLLPVVADDKHVWVKNRDGSYSGYQLNPFNMFFLVSSDTYNRWHIAFHVVELMLGLCFCVSMILFDTFMVTMCLAITCQLKLIADAYENLGYAEIYGHGRDKKQNSKAYLKDLKSMLKKHQQVLGKMYDFYKIIRPVILPQLIVASFTIINLLFVMTLNYFNGMLLTSTQSVKFFSFPTFVAQLYYTCLVFGNLNDQKNIMNFALYSSNWTQMDKQFKKLILLAMKMHDSNKLNMNLSPKFIFNLELFAKVIHTCYSIFSVLLNYQVKLRK